MPETIVTRTPIKTFLIRVAQTVKDRKYKEYFIRAVNQEEAVRQVVEKYTNEFGFRDVLVGQIHIEDTKRNITYKGIFSFVLDDENLRKAISWGIRERIDG